MSEASRPRAVPAIRALISRAVTFLESDQAEAWRCLSDASALLKPEPRVPGPKHAATIDVSRPGGLARWQANRVVEYVEANLESKVDIRALSDLVARSKSHFSRAFKRSVGIPPMAYVALRRVERAKGMMSSTTEQLRAIALACGFADQSHLSRSFRRVVGVSPGLWRRTEGCVCDNGTSALRHQQGMEKENVAPGPSLALAQSRPL